MPTYDYKCLECNVSFEAFQKMSDEPLTECPDCNGKVKRMIGAGLSPIFKGSGFYQTDYKNDSTKKKESSVNTSENTITPKLEKTDSASSASTDTKKAG